jgi:putative heme-binding domain-containing protein
VNRSNVSSSTPISFWCHGLVGLILAVWPNITLVPARAEEPRPAWTTSRLQGTPKPPAPYRIQPAFANLTFSKPTSLEEIPGERILVSEIGGTLYTFDKRDRHVKQKDVLLEIEGAAVWHATVHPRYEQNGQLFVCYSKDGTTHVVRLKVAGDPPVADPASQQILLTWPAGGHNAGCLQFGIDGMLYIATGDGSGPNPPDSRTAAQDVSNLFGSILRIDPDHPTDGRMYGIPQGNPFTDHENARPEIWSYGLRNPWKFGVDRKTGDLFAADNGWETWEMVHRIVPGGNCGWPIMEGRASLRSEVRRGPTEIRPPIKDHHHSEANSVVGGPIYRGDKLVDLQGTFIYGDYITGTIWGLDADGDQATRHRTLVDTDQRITAFAAGTDGEVFVLDYDYTGQVYELIPSGVEDRSAHFPRRLSETGLFTSLATMTPAAGVVPYDVVADRWIDGAKIHQRWVAIPGTGSIELATKDSPAEYPEGTVFVKHVVYAKQGANGQDVPIETQLLHLQDGSWHPYTYAWNSVLSTSPADKPPADKPPADKPPADKPPADAMLVDAMLVDSQGATRQVPLEDSGAGGQLTVDWHFNAENECRLCHNAGSGFVLGFVANQLDASSSRSSKRISQLKRLTEEQAISTLPMWPDENPGRLVDPHNEAESLDDRARSYLHANCSSCHHPRGNAIVSFYLRREMPFDELRTNKGTGIGTFGIANAKLIVPGDPYRSILLYRMTKLGYGRMPYIGSHVVDSEGVALIEAWIKAMPHENSEQDTAAATAGTAEASAINLMQEKPASAAFFKLDREPTATLFRSTEGALAVALAMHAESINPIDTTAAYRTKGSDIGGLFEDFVPRSERRKTLGRSVDPTPILSLNGSFERGRLIFFSDAARCRNCHHADDLTQSTGPTLTEIRKKYKRRSELLQHMLEPSLKVDEKYQTWTVTTADGLVTQGLIISRTEEKLVLKTADQKVLELSTEDIDEMIKSPQSLMPAGILGDLTAQEAADLLEWFGEF